jgi:hypothetical protein
MAKPFTPLPIPSVFAAPNWKTLLGEVRCSSLPAGVRMRLETWPLNFDGSGFVVLNYLGTVEALLATGCLTPAMMSNRAARRRGGRALRDEHGMRFTLHRSPSTGEPDRVELHRRPDVAVAMQLPGVRELFPEGITARNLGPVIEAHDGSVWRCYGRRIPPSRPRPSLRIVVNNEFAGGVTR